MTAMPCSLLMTMNRFAEPCSTTITSSTTKFFKPVDVFTDMQHPPESKWKQKSPRTWTAPDVLDWVFYEAEIRSIAMKNFKGESFQNMNGAMLCDLSRQDFLMKDEEFGGELYAALQECLKQYKECPDSTCWKEKHPEEWSSAEILDWIYYVASLSEMNLRSVKGENFQKLTGKEFCHMSLDEFRQRDPENGGFFYESLQVLLKACAFSPPAMLDNIKDEKDSFYLEPLSQAEENDIDAWDCYSLTPLLPPSDVNNSPGTLCHSTSSSSSSSLQHSRSNIIPSCVAAESVTCGTGEKKRRFGDSRRNNHFLLDSESVMSTALDVKRFKPSGLHMDSATAGCSKTPKQAPKTRLWKFMRDLLDNPKYNPDYIRWENQKEGVFRIVSGRSKAIADLWGKIKNNPTMTFDKLGRSLRWCRANNGLFSAMPKNGHFPKKLCFRFKTSQMD